MSKPENDLQKHIEEWQKEYSFLPLDKRVEESARWQSYWDKMATHARQGDKVGHALRDNVLRVLHEIGYLRPEYNILDVGCGEGAYALPFAFLCNQVTAIDISAGMLSYLEESCRQYDIENIDIQQKMWQLFKSDDLYDLVFSSMSPAICDYESLIKMERHSRGACCVVGVADGHMSALRHELSPQLNKEKEVSYLQKDALHQYRILKAMGRNPQIFFQDIHHAFTMPHSKAKSNMDMYYEALGYKNSEHKSTIHRFLRARTKNGYLQDERRYRVAVICWLAPLNDK